MIVRAVQGGDTRAADAADLDAVLAGPADVVWADLVHSDEPAVAALRDDFGYRAASIEECGNRTPVPKVELHTDHVFIAVNGLRRGSDDALHFQPLKLFLDERRLVTVLGPTDPSVDVGTCRAEVEAARQKLDDARLRPSTAFEVAHAVFGGTVGAHEKLVEELARTIGALEREILRCDPIRSEALIEQLFTLRHDLQTVRTNAAENCDVCVRLTELPGLREEAVFLATDLLHGFDHVRQVADLEREYLQELLDLLQTRIARELNVFVRQLTAWGAIGIAATLIAGIYGMNFAHMPELSWQLGYPLALGLMVVVGVILGVFFRRRGWL